VPARRCRARSSRLNAANIAGLAGPTIEAPPADLGGTPFIATPEEMIAYVAAETERWGKAMRFSGARVE
jgi:hypothetical protein